MTDHDYRLEDQREKTRKPNYLLRRILFAIVSIGLISSLTIMLTWPPRRAHGGRRVHRHRIVADRQIRAT
jgi:hypothetical protein